jgi:hypothetical protein
MQSLGFSFNQPPGAIGFASAEWRSTTLLVKSIASARRPN